MKDSTFLFPISTFRSLEHLFNITNKRLLLISTDKGYSFLEEIQGRGMPRVITHGSFSMMVNFHAIGKFFKNHGGDARHQSMREAIKTSVFVAGNQFGQLPSTHYAIQTFVEDFGPGDFFNFHKHLGNTKSECSLKTIISHMNFCRWDPRILNLFIDKISQEIQSANPHLITALEEGLPKVVSGIYDMPGVHESYFNIALLAHSLKQHERAIEFYEKVIEHGGKDFNVLYNMALCHSSLEQYATAQEHFRQAHALNPDSTETAEWIEWLDKKITKE
ncbi:MAG: tetratricopeptide repeat protein [Legionellales bacterium]|nr:tetratricopeptide repeat protein [Legionellales bacterium]